MNKILELNKKKKLGYAAVGALFAYFTVCGSKMSYIMTYILGMFGAVGCMIGFTHYATKGTILWEVVLLLGLTLVVPFTVLRVEKLLKERDNEST